MNFLTLARGAVYSNT